MASATQEAEIARATLSDLVRTLDPIRGDAPLKSSLSLF
jgi:hypothetical protein